MRSVVALPFVAVLAVVPLTLPACDDGTTGGSAGTFDSGGASGFDSGGSPDEDAAVTDSATADTSTADAADAADAAPSGGALSFDGVAAEVELPVAAGAANETAFSVEVWFKTTNATGTFFEVYGNGGADRFIFVDGGKVCFYVFTGGGNKTCTSTATYNDGAWHHAAGTLGAVGGTRVYVDGVLAPEATLATVTQSTFTTDTNFRLGYGHTDFVSAFNYYAGELDEVRVWSVERSAMDIQTNYRAHIDPGTAGLQGYWKLDEVGNATTTKDATSNGHDGTLTGFVIPPSPWVSPGAF